MLALPAIPLLALACVPLVGWGLRRAPVMAPWLAALPAALFLLVLTTPDGAMFSLPWIPTLGVELSASTACRAFSRC
ncbi:hypothetical protein GXW74_23140 [Roseomonas eburnea]|jgi:hypothetical protein|uniref:Uncharacterized protein n=2 Tax=Acetobacterales TaxID=3120395 RepID=A0A9X9XI64_9PROT|nr:MULTISPECIES: hypothetical protein [Neoroseomonas]MBR0683400.1 hypothetical protein [Neoroseomonas eburnea]MBW6400330.1 hypothetical protein [Neoroseomonas alba]